MNLSTGHVDFVPEDMVSDTDQKSKYAGYIKFGVILFVLAGLTLGGIYYYNYRIEQRIKTLDSKIAEQQKIIADLREFGVKGYKLGVRLEAAKDVMENRIVYSQLLTKLNSLVPENVNISDVNMTTLNDMVVSGEALGDYAPVGIFVENLLKENTVFSDVKITSASNQSDKEAVKYKLKIKLKKEGVSELIK